MNFNSQTKIFLNITKNWQRKWRERKNGWYSKCVSINNNWVNRLAKTRYDIINVENITYKLVLNAE